ncbi:Protein real-time [Seminavis robusta]|uniref:Protein real-time n=1 Tax=Seminavis robusta TaxID=568900 RepID=A0A9N8DHE9_9STRA|nr:Protein real-time [Seminavis robusta]|eukprot:Sro160_g072190.1 Protein real-time (282) ;mRNA; f:54982-55827
MMEETITIDHIDGDFEGIIRAPTSITIPDEGGYWEGTEKSQNAGLLRASTRRQSIIEVEAAHGRPFRAMHERFPDVSSHELVRFLKARNFDATKAIKMYEAHLKWHKETFPVPNEGAVKELMATRKFYMLDHPDEEGRPVIFYCLRRFSAAPYNVDNEVQALVWMMEHQVKPRFGPSFETQKVTVLIDVSGIRSPPVNFLQKVNTVMEANYPETLYRTIMFPVPFWLQKFVQGMLTFVDDNTRKKFAYVNDGKSMEQFAHLELEKMGPDIEELIETKQLKK